MIVILMGVSGSGKTTIGVLLAQRMRAVFADADDYHSEMNRAKMAAGHALNDDDRQPWLLTLNALVREWFEGGMCGVLACSALKAMYRETLISGIPKEAITFVLLEGPRELIAARLAGRQNHYMNPTLLDSQLATLETPTDGLRVVNDRPPEDVVNEIMQHLELHEEK